MIPRRIQRQRTKGWRMPEGAVYVGRPSRWGNSFAYLTRDALARVPAVRNPDQPWEYEGRISADGMQHNYHHSDGRITEVHVRYMTAAEVVECYRAYVNGGGWPLDWKPRLKFTIDDIRRELADRDLACWCPLDSPCHADVLLEIANGAVE